MKVYPGELPVNTAPVWPLDECSVWGRVPVPPCGNLD